MDKDSLRRELRNRAPKAKTKGDVVSVLFGWLSGRLPGTIATYSAIGDELDVSPLIARLPGWRWVLPRVDNEGSLSFRSADVEMETHRWGMRQPTDQGVEIPVPEIDVFLVPGLAFNILGERLGRGGGYYDSVLGRKRADAISIGVVLSDRVLERVPTERHDQRVDWLATELWVRRCRQLGAQQQRGHLKEV